MTIKLMKAGHAPGERHMLVTPMSPSRAVLLDAECASLVGGLAQIGSRLSPGRKGWRLPTVEELASLVDPTQELPALASGHPFGIGKGVALLGFWTHTTSAADHDQAYVVNFGNGSVFTETKQASIENPLPNLGEASCGGAATGTTPAPEPGRACGHR